MQRGDVLVRIGAALFAVGLVAVLVALVPYVVGNGDQPPLVLDLLVLLLPAGLGVALLGLLVGARSAR